MESKRRILSAANLAAYLIVLLACPNKSPVETSKTFRHGSIARNHILDISEDRCRTLMLVNGTVLMKAHAVTMTNQKGRPRRFWTVDCYDDRNELAFLVWNADNGELESINVPNKQPGDVTQPISARQAENCGLSWIRKLNLPGSEGPWKLVSKPDYSP